MLDKSNSTKVLAVSGAVESTTRSVVSLPPEVDPGFCLSAHESAIAVNVCCRGVGSGVAVSVGSGSGVGVAVGDGVGVRVGVAVGVGVRVAVGDGVGVRVAVGEGIRVEAAVGDGLGVAVRVGEAMAAGVAVAVSAGVADGVVVAPGVWVAVGVGVGAPRGSVVGRGGGTTTGVGLGPLGVGPVCSSVGPAVMMAEKVTRWPGSKSGPKARKRKYLRPPCGWKRKTRVSPLYRESKLWLSSSDTQALTLESTPVNTSKTTSSRGNASMH